MDIDVVIPHVDGSAPGYAGACREHTGHWAPCQVRALGELRFVLRSLERHVPWVRKPVIVVQGADHVPGWIEPGSVRVVEHAEFIPAEYLPTFHWATIAAHLHRVPGLADRFVIWDDDMLAARAVSRNDFFGADGLPVTGPLWAPIWPGLEKRLGSYQQILTWSRATLHRYTRPRSHAGACFLFPHRPLPVERGSWNRMLDALLPDPWFSETITRKSRTDAPSVDPLVLYANWLDLVERRQSSVLRYARFAIDGVRQLAGRAPLGMRPRFGTYPLVNDPRVVAARMRRLLRERPVFFNVNDNAYDGYRDADGVDWSTSEQPNPEALACLLDGLRTLFPGMSRFESSEDQNWLRRMAAARA
jgi:hypothetical protein